MSWIDSKIEPTDSASKKFIELYPQRLRQLARNLTQYRLDQYSKQEKVFEIDFDLVGRDSSQFHITQLPFSTIRHFITRNATNWKEEIYRAVREQEKDINEDNVSAIKTLHDLEYSLIYWSDYSIRGNQLHIKDIENNIYTYNLEFDSSIIGEIPNDSVLKVYPKENRIQIKTNHNGKQSIDLSQLDLEQNTKAPSDADNLVKILSVYYGIYPVAQIEDIDKEHITIVNSLGLSWEQPLANTYLITNDPMNHDRIKQFIDTPKKDRTLPEYYNLFGYPKKDANRLVNIQGEYDALAGEEFILYGMQKDIIATDTAKHISHIPHKPYPSVESVFSALTKAKEKIDSIKSNPTPSPIEMSSTELITQYKQDKKGHQWNILNVKNSLI